MLHATTPTRPTKALVATVLAVLGVAAIVAIAILAARDSSSPTRTHRTSPAAVETSPAPGTSPQSESSSTPAVSDAFGALAALISQGTASGDLDEHGAAELQHGLEEAARELQEGDAEKAAEKIADMREKLGELVDKGEVSETLARQIGAAIDVLGAAIGGSADGEEA